MEHPTKLSRIDHVSAVLSSRCREPAAFDIAAESRLRASDRPRRLSQGVHRDPRANVTGTWAREVTHVPGTVLRHAVGGMPRTNIRYIILSSARSSSLQVAVSCTAG